MKKIIVILIFVLTFAPFLYVETLPSSVVSVFSSQVGVEFLGWPNGQVQFYSEYADAKFVDKNHVEIEQYVFATVNYAGRLTNLVNHQNFSCQKNDVVLVMFKSQTEVVMIMPELDGELMTETFVFNDKTQEWELK